MSVERDMCERAGAPHWDEWLTRGVPESVRDHARDCERCAARLAQVDQLRTGMRELGAQTARTAAGIDVADSIMRALATADRPARARPRWWSWRALALPAAVAAVAAILLIVAIRDREPSARIDAPQGALAIGPDGDAREVRGAGIVLALPAEIRTGAGQTAIVSVGGSELELWPDSALRVSAEQTMLIDGGVAVSASGPVSVVAREAIVRGSGQFAVERTEMENQMRLTRKHKVAGAAVLAVVAVVGWATLSTSSGSSTSIDAPGGAVVDRDGRVQRFRLWSPDKTAAAATGNTGPGGAAGEADADRPRGGAFWNDDRQLIEFSLPGEVFDADTGNPLTSFRISAVATESQGYGQTRPRTWAFRDRADGMFELTGLGLGSWRINVEAPGYSPLALTVPLTELSADPHLVVPMSAGEQITGQVIDWRGQPVEGAKVALTECFDRDDDGLRTCAFAETKPDGTFALPGLPQDRTLSIHARHDRYGYATLHDVVRHAGSTEHVTIQLSGVVRLFGEVSLGKQKKPAVGAIVVSGDDRRATTDQNGTYELLVPLQSRPEAFVESAGGKPIGRAASYPDSRSAWTLSWVDAPTHVAQVRIDFRLQMENARLFGRITDSAGKPIPDVELRLSNTAGWADREHETFPTSARTDATGAYAVDHVPAKAGYNVHARLPGAAESRPIGYVNVPDEVPVEANFELGTGTIRGRFVDGKTGATIAVSERACDRLGARPVDGGPYRVTNCYDDGRFEIEGLPAGKYALENRLAWMASPIVIERESVTVGPGQIVDDVTVRIEGEPSDRWKLRILDQHGKFLVGAYIRYHSEGTSFTSNVDVGEDGITLVSIDRKYKTIFVDCAGYASKEIELASRDPAKVIELRLERLGAK